MQSRALPRRGVRGSATAEIGARFSLVVNPPRERPRHCRTTTFTYRSASLKLHRAPNHRHDGHVDTLTIRDRQPDDLERCIELLAEVHCLDGYPLNWPADPRGWLCPPGIRHAWIAEADGLGVVGHVSVHRATTPPRQDGRTAVVEVGRLFVAPAFRRRRVATTLLQQVRGWAADHQTDLILEVADSQRSAAIALYERSGWQHANTTAANWTAPDGSPVTLHRYTFRQDSGDTA